MFVKQPDDAQLVALWDDPETCPAIARRLGVRQTWLTLQWRRLRQQDRLPTDRRRNANERRVDESSGGASVRLHGSPSDVNPELARLASFPILFIDSLTGGGHACRSREASSHSPTCTVSGTQPTP